MRDIHKMGRIMVSLLWQTTKNKTQINEIKTEKNADEKRARHRLTKARL